MKRIKSCIFAAVFMIAGVGLFSAQPVWAATGVNVDTHTAAEITDYIQRNNVTINGTIEYAQQPKTTAPYSAGALSSSTQNSALNTLNAVRYIAGLNYNVTLNQKYIDYEQAGALVNAVNGVLTHHPSQPSGMSDSLYQLGTTGTSKGNIGRGYTNLNTDIVRGWMYDGTSSNIARVGHRRWILNPTMGQTGFGFVNGYTGMYAHDKSYSSNKYGVVWPAQTMPIEYFGTDYPWSYSYGQTLNESDISVTLVRKSDNKTWNFSKASANGDFYVENSYRGQPGCVIFRPSGITGYNAGDVFHVTIKNKGSVLADYNVSFFTLSQVTSFSLNNGNEIWSNGLVGNYIPMSVQSVVPAGAESNYEWSSSNESVATITRTTAESRVKVNIIGCGETTITAKALNGNVTVSTKVTVAHNTTGECLGCNQKGNPEGDEEEIVDADAEIGDGFYDVPVSHVFYDPVTWAAENGITTGTSPHSFSPDSGCTRGQIVTFLWRSAGSPEPSSYSNPFADVSESSPFFKAILWAVENGITNGTDETHFSPNATCTRGQAMTFLYRAAEKPGYAAACALSDVPSDMFYFDSVSWAVENGITSGTSAVTFSPNAECTRGQIVKFLYNYY